MKLDHRCPNCEEVIVHKKSCSSHSSEPERRKAVTEAARKLRDLLVASLPKGWRAVVVVTDFEGAFAGVAATTYEGDVKNILDCARNGADYECHAGEQYSVRGYILEEEKKA